MKQENGSKEKGKSAQEFFIPGWTKRPKKTTVFKDLDEESTKFQTSLFPKNLKEQKTRFMKYGLSPSFQYHKGYEAMKKAATKERYQIKTNLYHEAKAILDQVTAIHGNGTSFANVAFGDIIDQDEANEYIQQYISAHDLEGCMTVYWSPTLVASGKMMWTGPSQKLNKPELRRYSFVIKNASDNLYLRKDGIRCLVNHEIGTHYVRYCNDGYQPWFSDRKKFGLRTQNSRKMTASEEGLATINTLLSARSKYLWGAAVLYYVACKGAEMSFRQLFDHMAQYIPDKDVRWRQVVRVKRGVPDVTKAGGYGHDQVYFEGAVEILRNIDQIDFTVLHCGRICWDEVNRVKRLARMDYLKLPLFLKDMEKYKRMLKHIAYVNGLGEKPPRPPKPIRMKSASRFNVRIYQEPQAPKPKQEPDLPPLLNFDFKDQPVEFQPVVFDDSDDSDTTSCARCFIYPSDNGGLLKKHHHQQQQPPSSIRTEQMSRNSLNQISLKVMSVDSDGMDETIESDSVSQTIHSLNNNSQSPSQTIHSLNTDSKSLSQTFRSFNNNESKYNNNNDGISSRSCRLLSHRPISSPKHIRQNIVNYEKRYKIKNGQVVTVNN